MIKELKEEIKFAIENPILTLIVIGTFTGILQRRDYGGRITI